MKILNLSRLIPLVLCLAQPLAAESELVVVAAIGVIEPSGLQSSQPLAEGTRLALEPWGRALIRETTKCGLTHVIVGMSEHVLTLADDCSETQDPREVAARVQRGEKIAERLKETGSGLADDLVRALGLDPCVYLERFSEEGVGRRQCPSGYGLNGLRCSGAHCDDKDLMCCPYLEGAPDPGAQNAPARWISEEFPNSITSKKFLNGLSCRGPFCDDLLPQPFKSSRLAGAKKCEWTPWASEKPGAWLQCAAEELVAGIRCREQFCGDVGLYCCAVQVE